jgi:hypothetical protein
VKQPPQRHLRRMPHILIAQSPTTKPSSVKNSESLERAGWLGVLK